MPPHPIRELLYLCREEFQRQPRGRIARPDGTGSGRPWTEDWDRLRDRSASGPLERARVWRQGGEEPLLAVKVSLYSCNYIFISAENS